MMMRQMRSADREGACGEPSGGRDYWLAPRLARKVRRRAEIVFDVLVNVPLVQPAVVVTAGGTTGAVNAAFLTLAGGAPGDYLGRDWALFMPAWPWRAKLFRPGERRTFEERLVGVGGDAVWARVSLGPIARDPEESLGHVVFISIPAVDRVEQAEVRRLRKGVDLLAEVPADYVVEIDRSNAMTFVSPSFCRAVGARECDLIGHSFLSRVRVEDRAAAAGALAEARRPPFIGEMHARLSADRDADVDWEMQAVIGDGVAGLDLVGRVRRPA
jgi:PAS domain-containing protein